MSACKFNLEFDIFGMRRKNQGGIVYSTGSSQQGGHGKRPGSVNPSTQDLRVHIDRLKGNKVVTRITGFTGPADQLKELSKLLKNKCGVGGSAKDQIIVVQGDHRDKVINLLITEGYKAKKSGG
jgi:translation initiation factor 1